MLVGKELLEKSKSLSKKSEDEIARARSVLTDLVGSSIPGAFKKGDNHDELGTINSIFSNELKAKTIDESKKETINAKNEPNILNKFGIIPIQLDTKIKNMNTVNQNMR